MSYQGVGLSLKFRPNATRTFEFGLLDSTADRGLDYLMLKMLAMEMIVIPQ